MRIRLIFGADPLKMCGQLRYCKFESGREWFTNEFDKIRIPANALKMRILSYITISRILPF